MIQIKTAEDLKQLAGSRILEVQQVVGGAPAFVFLIEGPDEIRYRLTLTGCGVPALSGNIMVLNQQVTLNFVTADS